MLQIGGQRRLLFGGQGRWLQVLLQVAAAGGRGLLLLLLLLHRVMTNKGKGPHRGAGPGGQGPATGQEGDVTFAWFGANGIEGGRFRFGFLWMRMHSNLKH